MCDQLGVARSTYYAWRDRAETPTAARRRELAEHVKRVFDQARQTFGCRRVAAQLNREGHECSVGLVADLMRELGLKAVQPRASKRTTLPGEQPVDSPDLIGRDFDPASSAPGERLVGDITYLKTGEGWLYLATVIDLATRMVVRYGGWPTTCAPAWSSTPCAWASTPASPPRRGCQYTSSEFAQFCTDKQVRTSVGRTGVCWDNAAAESLFAALKTRRTTGRPSPPESEHGSPSPSTSRSSTTADGCTPPSATAPRSRRSPTTSKQQPPRDQQPEELSKTLDTAH